MLFHEFHFITISSKTTKLTICAFLYKAQLASRAIRRKTNHVKILSSWKHKHSTNLSASR